MRLLADVKERRLVSTSFGNECLLSGYASAAFADTRSCRAFLVQEAARTELDVVDGLIFRSRSPSDSDLPLRFHLRVRLPPFMANGRGVVELFLQTGNRATDQAQTAHRLTWAVLDATHIEKFSSEDASTADVAVVLASFNAPAELLEIQLRSIAQQTYRCHCVIVDDGSDIENLNVIRRAAAACGNTTLIKTGINKGFYANFEFGLAWTYSNRRPRFIALADQDDRWHPEKIATLVREIELSGSSLIFSDMRVTDVTGRVLSNTFWQQRKLALSPKTMRMKNFVTGMASLFRADLVPQSLPFPALPGVPYHDHWLARCAMRSDGIAYYSVPLLDYVQHSRNHTGVRDNDLGATAFLRRYMAFLLSRFLPQWLRTADRRQSVAFICQQIERLPEIAMLVRAGETEEIKLRRIALGAFFAGYRDCDTRVLSLSTFLLAHHLQCCGLRDPRGKIDKIVSSTAS